MGAVFRWVKYIYEWCKNFAYALSGSSFFYHSPYDQGVQFYVDGINGDDDNDGKSWAKAVATIGQAITLNNATIDWAVAGGLKEYNTIWIRPGVYDESLEHVPNFCHVIGLGIAGSDTAVSIHPATGSVFTGNPNMLGTHLANLRFEVNEAVAIFDLGVLNNSLIESCYFTNGANVAAWGIDCENSGGLTLRNCVFESGQLTGLTHGLWFRGFCSFAQIYDNVIQASTRGILIAVGPSSGTVIRHNTIYPFGAALAEGIEDAAGDSMVVDNNIMATDIINHAGAVGQLIRNRDSIGAGWEN